MPSFLGWSTGSFVFSGPNPFQNTSTRNGATYNNTILELRTDASGVAVDVNDDDPQFHDATHEYNGPQTLAAPVTIGGTSYAAGAGIIAEYRYVLRPTGSSDPNDNFSIIVFRIDGDLVGVTSTAPLSKGGRYQIVSGGTDDPDPFYSTLVPICFAPGALIDTPRGRRAVEALREGDLVATRDNGARAILWIGRQTRPGRGPAAPVRVLAGRLGNDRDLLLSPQHRVLVGQGATEALLPVKALIDGQGVLKVPCREVSYLHLLLEGHQVIAADGAAVESLLPGPQALVALGAGLSPASRSAFDAALAGRDWPLARPLLRPGAWRRGERHPRAAG
jgi:hypothetical protein